MQGVRATGTGLEIPDVNVWKCVNRICRLKCITQFLAVGPDACLLCARLSSMRQGRDASARRYEQIQEELQASDSSILQLEDSSQHTAEQYKFLQEMRGYVRDLLECFSEKVRTTLETVLLFLHHVSLIDDWV